MSPTPKQGSVADEREPEPEDGGRLSLFLAWWAYFVVTLVAPLALAAAGVWDWGVAFGVASGFWGLFIVISYMLAEAKPRRRTKRRRQAQSRMR